MSASGRYRIITWTVRPNTSLSRLPAAWSNQDTRVAMRRIDSSACRWYTVAANSSGRLGVIASCSAARRWVGISRSRSAAARGDMSRTSRTATSIGSTVITSASWCTVSRERTAGIWSEAMMPSRSALRSGCAPTTTRATSAGPSSFMTARIWTAGMPSSMLAAWFAFADMICVTTSFAGSTNPTLQACWTPGPGLLALACRRGPGLVTRALSPARSVPRERSQGTVAAVDVALRA